VAEGIQVMRLLWTRNDVSYHGSHFRLDHVTVEPKPRTQPCPPIWIAANADRPALIERSHERIALHADGWQTVRGAGEISGRLADIKRRMRAAGRDASSFTCSAYVNVNIDDDASAAYEETKRFLDLYFSADHSREEINGWCAAGSAEDCAKYLDRYREAGVDDLIVRCVSWRQKEQVARLRDEVLPRLSGLSPSTST
jgi:alkanesulfonate monooxygenase SsuD/methylene tetrahydromethanopterin reductase-like flavin-dependent oxidoreductase (luciferase family)